MGTITRSAKANKAAVSSVRLGAVSIKQKDALRSFNCRRPFAMPSKGNSTRCGVSAWRFSCHVVKVPCGSVSIRKTGPFPARSASTERCAQSVVLPLPPFCELITIVRMELCLHVCMHSCKHRKVQRQRQGGICHGTMAVDLLAQVIRERLALPALLNLHFQLRRDAGRDACGFLKAALLLLGLRALEVQIQK